jgi:hypothetical protein
MSPKNSLLTVGLSALGLFGFAVVRAALAADAQAPPGPSPTAPVPVAAPAPSQSVLLLSDGRILEGTLSIEGAEYVLRKRGGTIRFKKEQVVQPFGSVAEVYRYKRDQIPEDDPDEHLKLARWCLSQGLQPEARTELQKVVAVSSRSSEARAMLASIEASEARLASRRVDSEVVQTSGESVEPMKRAQRPGELPPVTLARIRREMGVSGLPVIFDLPPAVAVKRADQFARNVHPVLQAACARCHNERHDGPFQLVEVKSRRDWTQSVFRANLDATLQLIDKDTPAKSELLSRSLVPHGSTQTRQPIFRGSNDPQYQIIAAWVNSLRVEPSGGAAAGSRFIGTGRDAQVTPAGGGGFASERSASPLPFTPTPSGAAIPPAGAGLPANVKQEVIAPPPSRYVPGRGMVVENTPPGAREFPVPFVLGGTPPKPPAQPGSPAPVAAPRTGVPGRPGVAGQTGAAVKPGAPAAPGGAAGQPDAIPPGPSPDDPAIKEKALKKPVKVDTDLLQKFMENRNLAR